jgi:hypothetical protein
MPLGEHVREIPDSEEEPITSSPVVISFPAEDFRQALQTPLNTQFDAACDGQTPDEDDQEILPKSDRVLSSDPRISSDAVNTLDRSDPANEQPNNAPQQHDVDVDAITIHEQSLPKYSLSWTETNSEQLSDTIHSRHAHLQSRELAGYVQIGTEEDRYTHSQPNKSDSEQGVKSSPGLEVVAVHEKAGQLGRFQRAEEVLPSFLPVQSEGQQSPQRSEPDTTSQPIQFKIRSPGITPAEIHRGMASAASSLSGETGASRVEDAILDATTAAQQSRDNVEHQPAIMATAITDCVVRIILVVSWSELTSLVHCRRY